jgi:hypothetical protein
MTFRQLSQLFPECLSKIVLRRVQQGIGKLKLFTQIEPVQIDTVLSQLPQALAEHLLKRVLNMLRLVHVACHDQVFGPVTANDQN